MPCPFAGIGMTMPAGHPFMGSAAAGLGGCPVFSGAATMQPGQVQEGVLSTRPPPVPRKEKEIMDLLEDANVVMQYLNAPHKDSTLPVRGDVHLVHVETFQYSDKKNIHRGNVEVTIGKHQGVVCDGLGWALRHLEVGAIASVICGESYCGGGAQTAPVQGVTLRFEVKVMKGLKQGTEFWNMTSAERLAHIESIVAEAEDYISRGMLELGARTYEECISLLDCGWIATPEEKMKLRGLEINARVACAYAHLKRGSTLDRGVELCEEVLTDLDEGCVTAVVCKAQCLWRQNKHDEALTFLLTSRSRASDMALIDRVTEDIRADIHARTEAADFARKARSRFARQEEQSPAPLSAVAMAQAFKEGHCRGHPSLSTSAASLLILLAGAMLLQVLGGVTTSSTLVHKDDVIGWAPFIALVWVMDCALGLGELVEMLDPWQVPSGGSLVVRGLLVFLTVEWGPDVSGSTFFPILLSLWLFTDVVQQMHALALTRGWIKAPKVWMIRMVLAEFALEVVIMTVMSFSMRSPNDATAAIYGRTYWTHAAVFLVTTIAAMGQYLFFMDSRAHENDADDVVITLDHHKTK